VLIRWCQENLTPAAPQFEFLHHDVLYPERNPGEGKPEVAPFPAEDGSRTLVIAWSVFTHLVEAHAEYYLSEVSRVLSDDGVFASTWFLFDKRHFPMMQDFQNALYINDVNPTNAVILDRTWLTDAAARNGLAIVAADPPKVRGYHWLIRMAPLAAGLEAIELPVDEAPIDGTASTRAAPFEPDLSSNP